MGDASSSHLGRRVRSTGGTARRLASLSLVVLALGAVLFGTAWMIGGDDAVSDNWVGMTVVLALLAGLSGSLVAMVMALYAGMRREPWVSLWLPLATFPAVWPSSSCSRPSSSSDGRPRSWSDRRCARDTGRPT